MHIEVVTLETSDPRGAQRARKTDVVNPCEDSVLSDKTVSIEKYRCDGRASFSIYTLGVKDYKKNGL